MNVKDRGRVQRGMDEMPVYGVAEAIHHDRGDQKRHAEVEILIQEADGLDHVSYFLVIRLF